MDEIELELTFLAREIPNDLKQFSSTIIETYYFPSVRNVPSLRIRKKGDKYTLTKKMPIDGIDVSKQLEQNITIDEEEYKALAKNNSLKATKLRYNYNFEGKDCEIDIYQDELEGLVVVDFEFDSEQEKANFEMPDFCLVEVTQEDFISGGILAASTYEEIKEELDKYNYKKLLD